MQKESLTDALERHGGSVRATAAEYGVSRNTILYWMKKYEMPTTKKRTKAEVEKEIFSFYLPVDLVENWKQKAEAQGRSLSEYVGTLK